MFRLSPNNRNVRDLDIEIDVDFVVSPKFLFCKSSLNNRKKLYELFQLNVSFTNEGITFIPSMGKDDAPQINAK